MAKERMTYGGYGKMKRCKECGHMPKCFNQNNFFGDNGVCRNCGSEDFEIVIARPVFVEKWSLWNFLSLFDDGWTTDRFLQPEVKKVSKESP